jgi:predicted regulator of Ras-like GTPase activity (Roadblock/LC7/MglB family)
VGGGQKVAGDSMSIPYGSIIKLIPKELWGKLAPAGVAGYNLTISRATVVAQLPSGAVKVKFGEVRKGAPAGVFINSPAEDGRMVELPLNDILAQLHPDSYSRRADQGRVEVQQDVPDIFGANAVAGAPIRILEKKEVNTTSFARQKNPDPAAAHAEQAGISANVTPFPAVPQAPVAPAPAAPAAPAPIRMPVMPGFTPAVPAAKAPAASVPPIARVPTSHAARPLPKPPGAVPSSQPVGGFVPVAPIVPLAGPLAQGSFVMSLPAIAETWPDSVRKELAQLKIPDAKIALPPVDICEGLKRGRIQYPWRVLRAWIQPTPLYSTPSPNDDVVLELPLSTLTPAFLEFIRQNPLNRQTAAADNITEFFRRAEQTAVPSPNVMEALMETPAEVEQPVVFEAANDPSQPIFTAAPPTPAAVPGAPATVPVTVSPVIAGPAPEPVFANGRLCVPVTLISGQWTEAVLQDIAQFDLAQSRFDIPADVLEGGLKSGKVEFAWVELCGWLNPPSKPALVSINGDQRVSIPLHIVGPLFIKLRPTGGGRKRAEVMTEIPDLFNTGRGPSSTQAQIQAQQPPSVAPQPAVARPPAPVAPVASAPAPAPVPVAPVAPMAPVVPVAPVAAARPAPEPVAAPVRRATNLAELFGEPTKKTWTPNEIVHRSTQLPGVAGALIALQDGLLVASSLPQNMKTEMIAAFVPQIFGRLNQYSKELQLGEAAAISFTVEVGTMQIYNAGIIYFAALSKRGETLPSNDLQLIAAELSRHTK